MNTSSSSSKDCKSSKVLSSAQCCKGTSQLAACSETSWARPGFEPGTSHTRSENHTPKPMSGLLAYPCTVTERWPLTEWAGTSFDTKCFVVREPHSLAGNDFEYVL